jgi:hypothetical protein
MLFSKYEIDLTSKQQKTLQIKENTENGSACDYYGKTRVVDFASVAPEEGWRHEKRERGLGQEKGWTGQPNGIQSEPVTAHRHVPKQRDDPLPSLPRALQSCTRWLPAQVCRV